MKYTRVAAYISSTLWAITPDKFAELAAVVAYRAAGHEFTPAEIRARIGDSSGAMMPARRGGGVAVLPLRGVIAHRAGSMDESSGGTSTERFATMFRQVVADASISTVVLDICSPGGSVPGIMELAAEIYAARTEKTILAVSNSQMCSAAYWLGSQAHEVISIPSGMIGSIGVVAAHQDISSALEKEGIKITMLSAGRYKTEGSPFEALSADAKTHMQRRIDEAYAQFVKDVARGRGVTPAAVRGGFGEGRALSATDAKAAGLIDGISTFAGVLGRAFGRRPSALRASVGHDEDVRRRLLGLPGRARVAASDEDADRARRLRLV